MSYLTRGQLAKAAEVNIETIRFYERHGLIPEPFRTESGYRQYSEDIITRIRFIKRAKGLGFSLKEILALFSLRIGNNTTCGNIKLRAETKIVEIENKIRSLRQVKKALDTLVSTCNGRGPIGDCPILDALDAS